MKILAVVLSFLGSFFGPAPGTSAGNLTAADLFRSIVVPMLIYGLLMALPIAQSVPFLPFGVVILLDLLRRLPHTAVPGESSVPSLASLIPSAVSQVVAEAKPATSTGQVAAAAPEAPQVVVTIPPGL
jgi:hypothetical protein